LTRFVTIILLKYFLIYGFDVVQPEYYDFDCHDPASQFLAEKALCRITSYVVYHNQRIKTITQYL